MAEKSTESVVYVIGNADNRLVKIGFTTYQALERKSGIQTMSPSILTVLWTTPGGRELEDKLHYRFRAERRHGEWFDFGDRDPVATVSAAVDEIAIADGTLDPLEEFWQALERVRRWYLGDVDPKVREDAPIELGYIASYFADIVDDVLLFPAPSGRLAEARAALHVASDCLGGVEFPDVDGLASPKKLIAMASSTAWTAKCMAGAVEDDTFSLYAPEHVADFTKQAAVAVIALSRAVEMARRALFDAELRNDVGPKAHRALDSTVEEIGNLGRALLVAASSVRAFPYRGYVDRGDKALFDVMLDELEARGVEMEVSKRDMRVRFAYHDEPCVLFRGDRGWVVEWVGGPYKISRHLGALVEGGNHPGQIVSSALLFLDRKINNGTYPVELETPQYVSNPNWEEPVEQVYLTWEEEQAEDEAARQRGVELLRRWSSGPYGEVPPARTELPAQPGSSDELGA